MSQGRRRLTIFLITVIPLLVLLIAIVIYFVAQVRGVLGRLDIILADELRRQLNRDVKVAHVDASVFGTATVHRLKIADGKSFKQGIFFESPKVTIHYHWKDLIYGRKPSIQTVDSISIDSPKVLIERFKNGKLNVSDLLTPKPGPPRPPFIGVVNISKASFEFKDHLIDMPGRKSSTIHVVGLNGFFDSSAAPEYIYSFSGRGAGGKLVDRVAMSGSIMAKKGTISLDVRADNTSVPYWMSYFALPTTISIKQGTADLSISATRRTVKQHSSWIYSGSARLRNGKINMIGLRQPVSDVQGIINMANSRFNLAMQGKVGNSPIHVNGNIVASKKAALNIHVVSKRADFPNLVESAQTPPSLTGLHLMGNGQLMLDILGPVDDLVFGVKASGPTVVWNGYRTDNVKAAFTYSRGTIEVESAAAHTLGGQVTLSGRLLIGGRSPVVELNGAASNIALARIPQLKQAKISGPVSGRFTVTGTFNDPKLDANVQVSRGTLDKVALTGVSGRISITKNSVKVDRMSAAIANGVVRFAGKINPSKIDMRAEVEGVDFNKLQKPLGLNGYAGIFSFKGSIKGQLTNPVIMGSADLFDGRYQQYQLDYARGEFTATSKSISFKDALVRVVPAEIRLKGSISRLNTKSPSLDIAADVSEAQADRILSLLNVHSNVTGTVDGRISVHGAINDIQADGNVALTDGSIDAYPISEAHAGFSYANGRFELSEASAKSDGANLQASGEIDRSGKLNLAFSAAGISLARLSDQTKPYAVLSGTLDVKNGIVAGTVDNPSITALVVSENPTINTVTFGNFASEVGWNGSTISLADTTLDSTKSGKFQVKHVSIDTENQTLSVEGGEFKEFSYPSLYTVLAESPYLDLEDGAKLRSILAGLRRPVTGAISAAFDASGPMDDITASAKVNARDIDIAEIKNVGLDMTLSSHKGEIKLDSFDATADTLSVSASGTIISNGQTNLEVDAYNVDLGALTPATGPTHITGTATVRASISGPIAAPVIQASAEMVEPVIYGVKFDRLRASQITVGQDAAGHGFIDISKVLITRNNHSGSFYGILPWDWSEFAVPADKPMDLHARLDEQSLDLLAVFTNAVVADPNHAVLISGALDITGTLSNPNLSGNMKVSDGQITVKGIETPFTNINADLAFMQDMVKVNSFSGSSTAGGKFEIVPGGMISLNNLIDPKPEEPQGYLDLAVRLEGLKFTEANAFGYQERVSTSLDTISDNSGGGNQGITNVAVSDVVTIKGPILEPRIAGKVHIANATALLTRFKAPVGEKNWKFEFNPAFKLLFELGDNVWFDNQSINALIQGGGSLTGTLNNPKVDAGLRIARGTVSLTSVRMRLTSGTVSVAWAPPDEGPKVIVDIRAQTSIAATSPTGTQKRYTIVMNVRGPLDNLQPENVDLHSEPPGLSHPQILAALGHLEDIVGNSDLAFRQQLKDVFGAVSPMLLNPIESRFIEALGLEDFSIEYGFEQPLAVFISRRLFDGIYASYWRIVTGTPSLTGYTYNFRIGYRLKDWFELDYVTDSDRANILEASYNRRF